MISKTFDDRTCKNQEIGVFAQDQNRINSQARLGSSARSRMREVVDKEGKSRMQIYRRCNRGSLDLIIYHNVDNHLSKPL